MIKKLIYAVFAFSAITASSALAQSDNPCGAPALTPGASCSFATGSLPSSSTSTPGIPAPGCSSYAGQDVWYQVVVPATGTLTIDLNTVGGSITDMGMAWYSAATCNGPFTLIECDDDDSNNGLMPKIARTGMTPGSTVWVRLWEYGGNANGNFQICSFSPPPPTPCIGGSNNICSAADPFCTGPSINYCNSSGVPTMGSYGCLSSTPNPMWLFMEMSTGGNIDILISQHNNAGNPIDVDFALYGPFASTGAACTSIGPNSPTVDCSFSASATETANIVNAQPGQVYMMLVTNYNGAQGNIEFTQTGGTGTTNCANVLPCSVTATSVSDTCGSGSGRVTAVPNGLAPFTYNWTTIGNQTTPTVNGVTTGTHSVTVTAADGCVATTTVAVANYTPSSTGSSTPVSCAGGSNGTATATMVPAIGTVTYLWNDPAAQTTQTATGLAAGTYICTMTSSRGCVVTRTVVVTSIPGMTATITNQQNVTCNSQNNGIITVTPTLGTAPYTYAWDNSTSTASTANDLFAGTHTVTITDASGCSITQTATLTEPLPITIDFITPDSTICPEAAINLTVQASGGSSQYLYNWTEGAANSGGTEQTITVDPAVSGTQYCVTVTEACGSPAATSCMTITFPEPIVPNITPDRISDCQPAKFVFTNNSSYGDQIESTLFTFGNGLDSLVMGSNSAYSTYYNAQSYTVDVKITSIYGCVYTGTFPAIVEAIAIPTAAFIIAPNPTTIFETTVKMQNNSSDGSVYWNWSAPDATPSYSTGENPTFNFPEGFVGQYPIQLIVTTQEGCIDTVVNILTVNSDIIFYAPNAFTPNGDEHNQTWKFYTDGIDIYNFHVQMFNRWGEMIWESRDPEQGWDGTYDGKICPEGNYTWKASVKDPHTDNRKEFRGSVSLLK